MKYDEGGLSVRSGLRCGWVNEKYLHFEREQMRALCWNGRDRRRETNQNVSLK